MSFSVRARTQLLLAVASGLTGCHEQPAAAPTDAAPPSSSATSAVTVAQAPSASAAAPAKGLVCTDNAKPGHMCVTPRTPPVTGEKGHMQDDSFSAYDSNGCYAASALKGTCTGVTEATGPMSAGGKCCYDVCTVPVPCGRPIAVDGRARLAGVTTRDDWSGPLLARDSHGALRERAAAAWLEDARMEHASIAAFARLSLELMAVGAPSALVEAAHRAALQEIEHARTCFAIAAAFAHESTTQGPAQLPLNDLRLRSGLREIALDAATESCVGETVAALALARAAESCASRPDLRGRLLVMADEELSHAALGFRIVAWAFTQLDEPARHELCEALRVPVYDAPSFAYAAEAHAWRELGRITSADMRQVEDDARVLVASANDALRVSASRPTPFGRQASSHPPV